MKIIYWISTSLVSVLLVLSALSYFFHKVTIDGVRELGFPDFFRVELGVLKCLAAIVLIVPFFPVQFKEWAYAGVGLFIITAIVAHLVHRDPIVITLINILFLAILVVSNIYMNKVV